jgi:thioesterase domain-containing protein
MSESHLPVIVLSGAGGGKPDFSDFAAGRGQRLICEVVSYPGWQRYIENGFSAETLIEDLTATIAQKVPHGPIRLIGLSIGGHLCYAAALRLQEYGREIGGFCAIDSFMTVSPAPSAGWKLRAMTEGLELIRKGRIRELARFARSKVWRAILRLVGARLADLLRRFTPSGQLPSLALLDPILEEELTMRLMIRELAPWLASIDRKPTVLMAPALLLRAPSTARDDAIWRRRCPQMKILEISGQHHNLFEPENIGSLRDAFAAGTRNWR